MPAGYFPDFLQPLLGFLHRWLPWLVEEGGIEIGPLPKGTLINLISNMDLDPANKFEYVIVASGAGGGTVAARLAERGRKVSVLEAGGDPFQLQGGYAAYPGDNRLPEDYEVPVFHVGRGY